MVANAVSSRTQTDRHLALERMRTIGAHINTTESIILSLVGDASYSNFKEVQRIIKNPSADTGLIQTNVFADHIISPNGVSIKKDNNGAHNNIINASL